MNGILDDESVCYVLSMLMRSAVMGTSQGSKREEEMVSFVKGGEDDGTTDGNDLTRSDTSRRAERRPNVIQPRPNNTVATASGPSSAASSRDGLAVRWVRYIQGKVANPSVGDVGCMSALAAPPLPYPSHPTSSATPYHRTPFLREPVQGRHRRHRRRRRHHRHRRCCQA